MRDVKTGKKNDVRTGFDQNIIVRCAIVGAASVFASDMPAHPCTFPAELIGNKADRRTVFVRRIKTMHSNEEIRDIEHALRQFGQFQVLVHRQATQLAVSLVLGAVVALHQQTFRAFDHLALGQLELDFR